MQRHQEINSRNEYIKSLNGFLISAKGFLGETLQKLNWTESATVVKREEKPLITCQLESSHRIAYDNLDKHMELCRWHQLGYRDDDLPFPSPPKRLPVSSVVIDKNVQRDIILEAAQKNPSIKIGKNVYDRDVPQTSDRYFSDFTTDERRILYDHVVSKTAGFVPQLKEFNVTMKPEGHSAPMTREQLMAAERDAKRRRVKHRTAKVHTKSKNYSEVLREVIKNQMVGYEDWIRQNFGNSGAEDFGEPEKKGIEETKQENQEMVWLDWGFRGNPHVQWKQVLEKEKKRKERDERNSERSREKEKQKSYHGRRDREESSSGRYHKGELRRSDDDKPRRDLHIQEARYSGKRRNDFDKGSSERRSESFKKESHHSRYRRDRDEGEHLRTDRHKRDRYENEYKSKYRERNESKYENEYKSKYSEKSESKFETEYKSKDKERNESKHEKEYELKNKGKNETQKDPIVKGLERRLESHRDESKNKRCDSYGGRYEMIRGVKMKDEDIEDLQNRSYSYSRKSYGVVKVKKEEDGESTESDSSCDSSQSSDSTHSRKVKKRKKSKKKQKHKHKKKHKSDHS